MQSNYTKNQNQWKNYHRIIISGLITCAVLYFVLDHLQDIADYAKGTTYFVNTQGCRMVALNPTPMPMQKFVDLAEPLECKKIHLFRAETIENKNFLVWDMTEAEIRNAFLVLNVSDIYCMYRYFTGYNDNFNEYVDKNVFSLDSETKSLEIDPGRKMLRIKCMNWFSNNVYNDVHFFLPPTPEPSDAQLDNKKLSVLILGVDSISHMHALRSMNSTVNYIKSFPHVEFWGNNRVGSNYYPNLLPLLSGLNETQLEHSCYKERSAQDKLDNCDFLWKHFKAAGYNTSFGQDTSEGGVFIPTKEGFRQQATDNDLRPVMLEIETNTRYKSDERQHIDCTGNRLYTHVLKEFIDKLLPHMQHRPYFNFFWSTQGVQDYFNYAKLVDKYYLDMFRRFNGSGIMNHTIILFMSDHGMRFGAYRETYQGMQEESQPMLFAIYPAWLEQQYPLALDNLKHNAHRLVTSYDLHVTLMDLLKMEQLQDKHIIQRTANLLAKKQRLPRGISLFLPIPEQRDCAMAGIPPNYCQCKRLSELSRWDKRALRAANLLIQRINALVGNNKKCEKLTLNDIKAAYLLEKSAKQHQYIKVRVETKPGLAQFEATMRTTDNEQSFDGPVTRMNSYDKQAYCVEDDHIKNFCQCKLQIV